MAMTLVFEEQFEMPLGFHSLADFRQWSLSEAYPQRGRVDFVDGRIEIDMSAEELFTHGSPKVEIAIVLGLRASVRNWATCSWMTPEYPTARQACRPSRMSCLCPPTRSKRAAFG